MSPPLTQADLIEWALKLAGGEARGARFGLLLRQIDTSFAPAKYGYRTLRAFLEAHPDRVSVTHDGKDLVITSETANRAWSSKPPESGVKPMRPDLWAAFSYVNESLVRYYDKQNDAVITFPRHETSDEPNAVRASRETVRGDPHRFIEITPLASDAVLRIMRTLTADLGYNDPRRVLLEAALASRNSFRDFVTAIRQYPELESIWRRRRLDAVVEYVRTWMAARGLGIPRLFMTTDNAEPRQGTPRTASAGESSPTQSTEVAPRPLPTFPLPETVRARVLKALTRMPTAILLTLPIPAQYFFEDDDR